MQSHPSWVRGLKFDSKKTFRNFNYVAPFVGAWIEIEEDFLVNTNGLSVAPFVGAWIEIN